MSRSHHVPSSAAILAASAVVLGALGGLLLFAPSETARALGWGSETVAPALAASGFLAVAFLDWLGRGAIYGGIYGRPIVVANLVFAVTGGLALLNAQLDRAGASPLGWIPVAVLALHGLAFFVILRRGP